MKKIAVVGTGYVGLVTGTCFAETGNQVICVDIDKQKVERMRSGEVPIYEPHLDVLFERNIKANRLSFTTNLEEGIKDAEIIFLALPTPPGEDGSADLRYILGVADDLGKKYIEFIFKRNSLAKEQTAKELGIDRKTLYRKLKEIEAH